MVFINERMGEELASAVEVYCMEIIDCNVTLLVDSSAISKYFSKDVTADTLTQVMCMYQL